MIGGNDSEITLNLTTPCIRLAGNQRGECFLLLRFGFDIGMTLYSMMLDSGVRIQTLGNRYGSVTDNARQWYLTSYKNMLLHP